MRFAYYTLQNHDGLVGCKKRERITPLATHKKLAYAAFCSLTVPLSSATVRSSSLTNA